MFNLFKELPYCFPKGLCYLTSSSAMCEGSYLSVSLPLPVIVCLLILTFLVSVKWYLIVVLIWITLIINDFEHLFMCVLVIHMSLLVKFLFKSLPILKLSCLFYYWVIRVLCKCFIRHGICKYFLPICGLSSFS